MKALLLMAEDLHIAALQAASADRAVVEPSPVTDELDDAHREAHITPGESRLAAIAALTSTLDARAARWADHRRVHRPIGKHHAVTRLQLQAATFAFQHERD